MHRTALWAWILCKPRIFKLLGYMLRCFVVDTDDFGVLSDSVYAGEGIEF